jgi:hypothetical protein
VVQIEVLEEEIRIDELRALADRELVSVRLG